MATNYAAQNYNVPDGQLSFYNSQQPSPESGSPTPTNTSPTSPRMDTYLKYQLPAQVRQLRPPKSPLYVPAALRPTERVPGKSPMTPPKSLRDSPDSLEQGNYNSRADEESPTVFDLAVQQGLFTDEDLGEVTGPPTKEHWKPDEASPTCDSPKCRSSFNLFVRKHHCRYCGHIFCSEHTHNTIPLNQDAKFHPDGIQSRACDSCYRQYQKWDNARSIRHKNTDEENSDSGSGIVSGSEGVTQTRNILSQHMGAQGSDPVASSVPKDWAWSTF